MTSVTRIEKTGSKSAIYALDTLGDRARTYSMLCSDATARAATASGCFDTDVIGDLDIRHAHIRLGAGR